MTKLKNGKRKDGRYQASILLENGKRKVIYGNTRAQLKENIQKFRENENLAPLFQKVSDEWYESYYRTVSPKTLTHYDPANARVDKQFGHRRIDDIEPADIQAFLNSLKIQGFSSNYIKAHRTVLNKIFEFEILKHGSKLKNNPVTSTRIPRVPKKKRPAASPEQEDTVRRFVDHPFGLFAYLLLYTGCRPQEAFALQWCDIDFENKTLDINKAVTWPHNQPVIKETKTANGVRIVPLLEPLKNKLYEKMINENPDKYDYIFGGEEPLSYQEFRRRWRRYAIDAGFQKETFIDSNGRELKSLSELQRIPHKRKTECTLVPYQLRHSYATMCFEAGLAPEDAQKFMGHSDIRTTVNIYTDIRSSKQKIAADKLDKYASETAYSFNKNNQ